VRPSLALVLGVLVLGGCGGSGGPAIEHDLAVELANQADAIASASGPCAARTHARILQRQTIAAVNAGRIPAAYQETLTSRVNEIVATLQLRCLPTPSPAAAASTAPLPPQVVAVHPPGKHGESKSHGHGKGHGKDKGD
jgi:hypothetical protein